MNARGLMFATLASLCASACMLGAGVNAASASPAQLVPAQELALEGVAVNQASGDVYVADELEAQVAVFDSSGALQRTFGKSLFGESRTHGGVGPEGVAVDNELSSLSYGDVYVVDGQNNRIDKFTASGEFLLMFGGDVNEKTGGNVCVKGEACKSGTVGAADGQFDLAPYKNVIGVGPEGRVYVGDRARVQIFEPSGAWRENISLSGLSSTGRVSALAVDSTGDMFVKIGSRVQAEGAVPGVREFAPNGTEDATQFDVGSETVEALAVDGSGDVFVGDSSNGGKVLEYDPTGKKLTSLGLNTPEFAKGIAYAAGLGALYVSGERSPGQGQIEQAVWILTLPVLGPPTIEADSLSATPSPRGHASLTAKFNPGGFETTFHFEYVDDADFQASGYAHASSTPDLSVEANFEEQTPNVALTGLVAGAVYHYRLVAVNQKGTVTSPDQTYQQTPAALVKGPWVTNVSATSASFGAEIDPLGVDTEYRLEYGPNASYGTVISGSIGAGESYSSIGFYRQELVPGETYHYRVVLDNAFGTAESADRVFTTQPPGAASALPDGRTWELVSPPNKKGALIELFEQGGQLQAANDGSGITYISQGPAVGENPQGKITYAQVLATRGSDAWKSVDLTLPGRLPENGESSETINAFNFEYGLFSPDLSLAVVEPQWGGTPPLPPVEPAERTLYLRDDATGSFSPLVTPANVPSGTKIEEPSLVGGSQSLWEMHFLAATPDLNHIVFKTPMALTPAEGQTPAAIDEENVQENSGANEEVQWNLYEWSEGQLHLVNVLPENKGVAHGPEPAFPGVRLAGMGNYTGLARGGSQRAVSDDGRRIAWAWGEPYGNPQKLKEYRGLYVRDMVEEKTVRVGGADAIYQTMNSDGSKIFYLENGDLYEFDYETGTQTDLTGVHGPGESSAGVHEVVSDVSEDGSYVYFVATGVLADGGVVGENNLYLSHDTGSGWTTTYIATLSQKDEPSWHDISIQDSPLLSGVSSRVSPDGRYLAFMSERSLTGYDNTDAVSGQPDEEVYLYDAQEGKLVCASCNPTGARPVGIFDGKVNRPLVDHTGVWASVNLGGSAKSDHWLAGSIPGWDERNSDPATYQPRYLSDSGRLFFDSPDALVAQDTNGLEDPYEYEPAGVGDCTTAGRGFSKRSDGCVSLLSSGTSSSESAFYDASENGDDVFFATAGKLVGEDYDKGYDVYDAHVCTTTVPCEPVPVSPPPCTSGDSCKAAPSPQPEIFGPAPSATFNGIGNVTALPTVHVITKSLTNTQKLARALRACHKQRGKQRRACEARVRKRYPLKRVSKAVKTTRKGTR
jgi:hypothetical protein